MAQLLSGASGSAIGGAAADQALSKGAATGSANGGGGMWYDLGQQMGQDAAEQAHSAPPVQQPQMDNSWMQGDTGGSAPLDEQPIDFSSLLKFF